VSGVVGSQVPRHRVAAAYSVSAGGDAGELGRAYGLTPDPWQQQVLDDWLAVGSNGRLASGVCGVFVPRQNGKNAILEIVELFKATIQGRRILHTAHELKSARKAFMRLRSFFENERQRLSVSVVVRVGVRLSLWLVLGVLLAGLRLMIWCVMRLRSCRMSSWRLCFLP